MNEYEREREMETRPGGKFDPWFLVDTQNAVPV